MKPLGESWAPGPEQFTTTQWSLVVAAGAAQSPQARQALEALCRRYWFPLYAFVRRQGIALHEAQDLTQEFFARFLDRDYLGDVDRQRGKFRSFLLAALKHFLANHWDRARARKRGGGKTVFSIDYQDAEKRYLREPVDQWTAEKLFQRRWALELLGTVLRRLQEEAAAAGKGPLFEEVKDYLTGTDARGYQEVARKLALSEGALKTAIHRLRRRYRQLLRAEIAQTVADAAQVDEEIRQVFADLRGGP